MEVMIEIGLAPAVVEALVEAGVIADRVPEEDR
jgi:hypothetical protein